MDGLNQFKFPAPYLWRGLSLEEPALPTGLRVDEGVIPVLDYFQSGFFEQAFSYQETIHPQSTAAADYALITADPNLHRYIRFLNVIHGGGAAAKSSTFYLKSPNASGSSGGPGAMLLKDQSTTNGATSTTDDVMPTRSWLVPAGWALHVVAPITVAGETFSYRLGFISQAAGALLQTL